MKTKTTTREYDDKGRMVKETIYEYEQAAPVAQCVCWQPWYSTSGRNCPVHGYVAPTQIWCDGVYTPTSGTVTINSGSSATDRLQAFV